jgi:rhodanese-related sulfurtransferase
MNETALLDPQAETGDALSPEVIFDRAAVRRVELDLDYAGAVTPPEAWALVRQGAATLIDVRTAPEFKFVGRVPDTANVVWHGADPVASAGFALALRAATSVHTPLLLLCRSGVRSDAAAAAATEAGFRAVYNVLEGFEGQRDQAQQRGFMDGWRKHGLPWVQD